MLRYLIFLIIGIIIFIMLNGKDGFSVGMPWCIQSISDPEAPAPANPDNENGIFQDDEYDNAAELLGESTEYEIVICDPNGIITPQPINVVLPDGTNVAIRTPQETTDDGTAFDPETYKDEEFNLENIPGHYYIFISTDSKKYLKLGSPPPLSIDSFKLSKYKQLDPILHLVFNQFNIPMITIASDFEILYSSLGYYGFVTSNIIEETNHYTLQHFNIEEDRDGEIWDRLKLILNDQIYTSLYINVYLLFNSDTQCKIFFNIDEDKNITNVNVVFYDMTESLFNNMLPIKGLGFNTFLEKNITHQQYIDLSNDELNQLFTEFDNFAEYMFQVGIQNDLFSYIDLSNIFTTIKTKLKDVFSMLDLLGFDPSMIKKFKKLLMYRLKWLINKFNETYKIVPDFVPLDITLDLELERLFIEEGVPPTSCASEVSGGASGA